MGHLQSPKSVWKMDSDSDSDGSHVSATPPRHPNPPPPPTLSNKTKTKAKTKTKTTPLSKPKIPPPPPPKPTPPAIPSLLSSSYLPFTIRLPSSHQPRSIPAVDSVHALPAGFFSAVPSFSRIRRSSLAFESDEVPKSDPGTSETTRSAKRKHPNLITCDHADSAPVKVPKRGSSSGGGGGVSEGNFVKLNLNGRKRGKFPSKCKSRGKSSSSYTWRRRRSGGKSKAETGADGNLEEEIPLQQHEVKEGERPGGGVFKAVEDAVMAVREEASDGNLLRLLDLVYGYDSFRDGQLEAIKMVLSGKSTMLVLPTGAGKSLCYQIPALILPGLTLVVSPLVALMIDQLMQLPPVIRGGLLSSSQRPEEVTETLRQLREGTIKVLFVAPERFMNAEFLSIFSAASSVSLVVVDEAHCISEWSHNFRPSYMRLRASLLRSKLNVECILAMTATATTTTLQAVMSALEIPSTNLIQKAQLRDNLELSVSLSGTNRMKDLLLLMKSSPFNEVQSIIIYCKFQFETDMLSKYLCDNNIPAKSYHSGLFAKNHSRVQELFCANKIRVVVATVAFGMGLDKRDVGAVIHYSLPESLEEYVQEIGRAGRDGRLSHCHLFYDDNTYFKLRSLAHSDGVDEYTVSRFLTQVFSTETNQHGKICSLVKESASRKFDMKEEVMLTLLTHLELGEVKYLHILPQINISCTLNFHKTPQGMLAEKNSVVAAILKKSQVKQGQYVFDITNVANSIGVTATEVSTQLENLKMKGEITYDMKDPAFCYTIVEFPQDFCSLSYYLTKWLSEIETCKIRKLDAMSHAAVSVIDVCNKTTGCSSVQQTTCLQRKILDYFKGVDDCAPMKKMTQSCRFLHADIKVFLQSNSQAKFTPRAVARIMHGIPSPTYPSAIWSKSHFWGVYMHVDFQAIMKAAKAELLNFVGKDASLAT